MGVDADLFAPLEAGRYGGMIDRYLALPGVHDEMIDAEGRVRPHWRGFLDSLAGLGRDALEKRFASADQYLRESGVFYRVYDDKAGVERPWPISHVPLIVAPEDWAELCAGLIARAEAWEGLIADVYGPGKLVSEGFLPAAAVAGSPEFLRPLVGARPAGGRHLLFYGVDVGRGPDGRWWALGDRAQAPSGAGYALENRLAMTRALPETYAGLNVERLAGFFQEFRAGLAAENPEARIGVLTPGPLNETYFEHAYLARYLGFLLVEGGDLIVREDAVFIRTVAGLKRINALWRRLDAGFADPLELDARSHLGVPGLVGAARKGAVTLANSLGAGLIESRALLSFLPGATRRLNDAELEMPHVATWWCGQHLEREMALENLSALVVAPAFGASVRGVLENGPVLAGDLSARERGRLADEIRARGADFVAQEVVKLSTTPVWSGGRLEPRPFALRVFLANVDGRWIVMPGGFCRIADRVDARAVTMQQGGRTADVVVTSNRQAETISLLPQPGAVAIRRALDPLPSRAADNLFWLGRYTERAEMTLRLLRALGGQFTGAEDVAADAQRRIVSLLAAWGAIEEEAAANAPADLAAFALHHSAPPGGVLQIVEAANRAASVIRDRFSPDAWRTLADLQTLVRRKGAAADPTTAFERVEAALRLIAALSGLAQENMNQALGWRFLKFGRRLERGLATARFVRQFGLPREGAPDSPSASELNVLLALADSQITYRLRYVMVAARAPVLDLVALDESNPRSIAFQVARLREHLFQLPGHGHDGVLTHPERIVTRLEADLRTVAPDDIDDHFAAGVEMGLMRLSNDVSDRYFVLRDSLLASGEAGE